MVLDAAAARDRIACGDLRGLFIEQLGWNKNSFGGSASVDGYAYGLVAIAGSSGFLALEVAPDPDGRIPSPTVRAAIQVQARRLAYEHLLVFVNRARTEMLWQPPLGLGANVLAHRCYVHEVGEGLMQILRQLCQWGTDPRAITLPSVASAVRSAFRSDRYDYYADYFRRLAEAEAEAGLKSYLVRKSAWNYEDNIGLHHLEEDDYAHITSAFGAVAAASLRPPLSMDTTYSPFNSGRASAWAAVLHADLLQNTNSNTEEAAGHRLLSEQLAEVLTTLASRERRILESRFGLVDGRSRTLEEVGDEFGVTRERIRQIESKALKKLLHPSRAKRLANWLDEDFGLGTGPSVAPAWLVGQFGARWVAPRDENGAPVPVPKISYWSLRRPRPSGLARLAPARSFPPSAGPSLLPQGIPSRAHVLLSVGDFVIADTRPDPSDNGVPLLADEAFVVEDPPAPPTRAHQPPLELPGALPLFGALAPVPAQIESSSAPSVDPPAEPVAPLPDSASPKELLRLAVEAFRNDGYEVVDLRPKGGCLWVYGGMELGGKMAGLRTVGVRFLHAEHTSDKKWGWWHK